MKSLQEFGFVKYISTLQLFTESYNFMLPFAYCMTHKSLLI